MSDNSKIEWTDATWNPVTGCTKVSPGCANCYMFREYPRLARMGVPGYAGGTPDQVRIWPERLKEPIHWRKPRRVFVCSMADLFHGDVPEDFILKVLGTCVASLNQWSSAAKLFGGHIFQILTKRPERMAVVVPKLTACTVVNPVPVMVTLVPPATGPLVRESEVMVGP